MKHIDIPDLFKETNQYFRELIETKKTSYHYQNYLNRLHYLKNCVLSEWDIAYQAKDYAKLEYIAHFVIELQKLKNTIETSHDITEVEKNLEAVLEVAKTSHVDWKKTCGYYRRVCGRDCGRYHWGDYGNNQSRYFTGNHSWRHYCPLGFLYT